MSFHEVFQEMRFCHRQNAINTQYVEGRMSSELLHRIYYNTLQLTNHPINLIEKYYEKNKRLNLNLV